MSFKRLLIIVLLFFVCLAAAGWWYWRMVRFADISSYRGDGKIYRLGYPENFLTRGYNVELLKVNLARCNLSDTLIIGKFPWNIYKPETCNLRVHSSTRWTNIPPEFADIYVQIRFETSDGEVFWEVKSPLGEWEVISENARVPRGFPKNSFKLYYCVDYKNEMCKLVYCFDWTKVTKKDFPIRVLVKMSCDDISRDSVQMSLDLSSGGLM